MRTRTLLQLSTSDHGDVVHTLRRWIGEAPCWLARVLLSCFAVGLLAVECEIYRSFDEWNFNLADTMHAAKAVLRSLGPLR